MSERDSFWKIYREMLADFAVSWREPVAALTVAVTIIVGGLLVIVAGTVGLVWLIRVCT